MSGTIIFNRALSEACAQYKLSGITLERFRAGEYAVIRPSTDPAVYRYVRVTKTELGWIAAADWDRYNYSDPLSTFAEALGVAAFQIADSDKAGA
jgi:hypothetical protein